MICNHCGYCCIYYDAMIVNDPNLGITEENIIHKPSGVVCKHLSGATPGEYRCSIHDFDWFKSTPCHDFGQIENSPDDLCRIGEYILVNKEAK